MLDRVSTDDVCIQEAMFRFHCQPLKQVSRDLSPKFTSRKFIRQTGRLLLGTFLQATSSFFQQQFGLEQ